mmetsp:Transcript_8719/g.28764  ORF Transcript_8719/g.28764 Transcript_8719/m.28764 type:complete len:209 (-) Transcript_8719:252-878(-)
MGAQCCRPVVIDGLNAPPGSSMHVPPRQIPPVPEHRCVMAGRSRPHLSPGADSHCLICKRSMIPHELEGMGHGGIKVRLPTRSEVHVSAPDCEPPPLAAARGHQRWDRAWSPLIRACLRSGAGGGARGRRGGAGEPAVPCACGTRLQGSKALLQPDLPPRLLPGGREGGVGVTLLRRLPTSCSGGRPAPIRSEPTGARTLTGCDRHRP